MNSIKDLYKRKRLYTVLGILSLITPLPGVGIGLFIQAGVVDSRIKKMAIEDERRLLEK